MDAMLTIPLSIAALAVAGFTVNEWSEGGVSDAVGLGPHHMLQAPHPQCPRSTAAVEADSPCATRREVVPPGG